MKEHLGILRTVADVNLFEEWDHFTAGGVASGAIGDLGWIETNSASGTNAKQAGGVTHPGVLRIVTGAVSGNNKRLHLGTTASDACFAPTLFERFRWVCRIPTITTLAVRLGLMQDISAASGGTAGAFFEFDPAVNAAWTSNVRQASTSTQTAIGSSVVANNWYLLEARREAARWVFSLNGAEVSTPSTNLPTTACAFGVLCQTGTTAARNIDLDLCYIRGGLGQLWT